MTIILLFISCFLCFLDFLVEEAPDLAGHLDCRASKCDNMREDYGDKDENQL
jgi:hypothetical protein